VEGERIKLDNERLERGIDTFFKNIFDERKNLWGGEGWYWNEKRGRLRGEGRVAIWAEIFTHASILFVHFIITACDQQFYFYFLLVLRKLRKLGNSFRS
jgi:hypothetical protein